ncbi:hypothetical protein BOS5A_110583 [Bosea sp. EC-HK365B]|nr:hypothetical protein BOSE21B_110126 [Bosea sp. 21B]VVT52156.1 hypothetical protein BOS5A_110583 [Bosea sp. EC-HK365B]VXC89258.1 hypothetical protein BOSE127_70131 [Bosea sp. 127]
MAAGPVFGCRASAGRGAGLRHPQVTPGWRHATMGRPYRDRILPNDDRAEPRQGLSHPELEPDQAFGARTQGRRRLAEPRGRRRRGGDPGSRRQRR